MNGTEFKLKKRVLILCLSLIVVRSTSFGANRIVTLAPVLSEWTAQILGPEKTKSKIVGVSEYSVYPISLKAVTTVGAYHQLNVEKIAALKPDLVIASSEYNRAEQIEQLKRLHLTVQMLPKEDFNKMPEWIESLGRALDEKNGALISAGEWKKKVLTLQKRKPTRLRSLFLEVQHQPLVTVGGSSFLNQAFLLAGYQNIFSDLEQGYPKVSKESVLKLNPDTIFILDLTGVKEDFENAKSDWQNFKELKAVKNNHIKTIPGDDFARCSFRLLDALSKL